MLRGSPSLVAEIEAEEEISAPEKLMKFKSGLKSSLQLVALFDTQTGKPFTSVEALIEFLTRYDAALSGVQSVHGPRAAPSDARPHKRLRGPPAQAAVARAPVPEVGNSNQFPALGAFVQNGVGQGRAGVGTPGSMAALRGCGLILGAEFPRTGCAGSVAGMAARAGATERRYQV
jgi:hypothetical protein